MDPASLEKLFHEPNRLAILCELLKAPEGFDFTTLKTACSLTDGNLNRHLTKLEQAKVVRIKKAFVDKKPRTTVILTAFGRKAFASFIDELEQIVNRAAKRISEIEADEKKLGSAFSGTALAAEKS